MTENMRILLENFGYDTHTARLIEAQANQHGLNLTDVADWIREATCSRTIHNPRGFVRARIGSGDKPPLRSASRSTHSPLSHYLSEHFCPDCQARPCICDWNPEIETFTDFRERTTQTTGETT